MRLLDTGPGNVWQLSEILNRSTHVVVPVRMEPMTMQALGLFLPRLRAVQACAGGRPALLGLIATHFVTRSTEHRSVLDQLGLFARQQGTEVLGVVPFTIGVGMRLSTRGHHYRPIAERVLGLVGAAAA